MGTRESARQRMTIKRQNPEFVAKEREYYNNTYKRNHIKHLILNAKKRAKALGLDVDIVPEDITIPEICPLLGVPMIRGTRTAPSIDRIIPSKGYIKGNIMIISHKANMMKSSASMEELSTFCKNALKIYNLT